MSYPIEGLTDLEQRVFTFVTKECFWGEPSVLVDDISEDLEINKSTVKGVVGSLVKKGHVVTLSKELTPVFFGGELCNANECDHVSDEGMVLAEKVSKFKFN